MCIDSFSLAVKSAMHSPKYWLTFIPKFAYYALFKRIDVIQGMHAKIPDEHGTVICLSNMPWRLYQKDCGKRQSYAHRGMSTKPKRDP
jgi:hypothetical protein